MKTKLFMLLCLFSFCTLAQERPKNVAVYVVGADDAEIENEKKILGNELVSAIVKRKKYQAIERTAEFLNEINKEHKYQLSGNVDDEHISQLGKQMGVDLICVLEITEMTGRQYWKYYVQSRLVDVEKALIVKTTAVTLNGPLSIDGISEKANEIAEELFSGEKSTYESRKAGACSLVSVDNTGFTTNVNFQYYLAGLESERLYVSKDTYILDKKTGARYKLLSADGIGIGSWSTVFVQPGCVKFTLRFEKIPSSLTYLDVIESNGRQFYGVSLNKSDKEGFFQFRDEMKILQEEAEKIARAKEGDWYLTVRNTHSSPRKIYINDKYIGLVPGYGEATFNVSTKVYGAVESVQASGYIFTPNKEHAHVSQQYRSAKVSLKF